MSNAVEKRVFFDMAVDDKPIGRIEIRLFTEDAPKTCENFRALCTGEVGMAPNNKARLHYKGNQFHRIVKKFMIQGGDITEGDGRGGYSIYGRYFDDEKFNLKHSKPFLLSMANKGPNSNSSQFFITTAPAPHCNGKHVVFGEVIRGQNVVELIENLEVDDGSKPTSQVIISNCGELVKKKKSAANLEELAEIERKKKEEKEKIPDGPKSWLYRDVEEKRSPRSSSRRRDHYRSHDRGDSRRRRSRSRSRKSRGRRHDDESENVKRIRVRGRGGVRYKRDRSTTPEHWKRNAPIKWADLNTNEINK